MANKIEKQFLDTENKGPVRLNKYLSEAGVCSRREADKLIAAGQVTVDGVRAETGMKVEPWQVVRIGKKQVSRQEEMIVLAVNKPRGIVCTEERRERDSIVRFLNYPVRITYVGRLDKDSEGLLLLSDEKGLADRLLNPSGRHPRTYWSQVEGTPSETDLRPLELGDLRIRGYCTLPCRARLMRREPDVPPRIPPVRYRASIPTSWLELTLVEGKNRQVRRMTAAIGFPTLRLLRARIGNFSLAGLKPGAWKELDSRERRQLMP